MFSGIIKNIGKIRKIYNENNNCIIEIFSKINFSKKEIGSSVSCSGACLTLEKFKGNSIKFYLSKETLNKTIFKFSKKGDLINLEKSLKYGERVSGHYVQGHIDTICIVSKIVIVGRSWLINFRLSKKFKKYLVPKGSITINGISLTITKLLNNGFQIAVIPKTLKLTNLIYLKEKDLVNVEFDLLGKYVKHFFHLNNFSSQKNNFSNIKMIKYSKITDLVSEAKKGKMFILVDDENRENEGDLIISASKATPSSINFMAKHGRGLICLTLCQKQADKLNLSLMSPDNISRSQTAFTVSIDAKSGVTTGISAQDRFETIKRAIQKKVSPKSFVSPGHVFPIVAKNGGVLVRAGHTEASVDITKFAKCGSSAVICEIMNDDGTMAKGIQLLNFAKKHKLKVGKIDDLIAYRLNRENFIKLKKTSNIKINNQVYVIKIFENLLDGSENFALVKGNLQKNKNPRVRVISSNIVKSYLMGEKLPNSFNRTISYFKNYKDCVLIFIRDTNLRSVSETLRAYKSKNFYKKGQNKLIKNYGIGAQIIKFLNIKKNGFSYKIKKKSSWFGWIWYKNNKTRNNKMKDKLCIVIANYYPEISKELLIGASKILIKYGFKEYKKIVAPGIFEIPAIIARNINDYDAFIALGCVIKGKTPHFNFISNATTNAIMHLSIIHKKPIGNGIITCLNKKQALERCNPMKKNKGGEAAKAALTVLGI